MPRIFSSVLTLAPEDRTARGMLKALQAELPLPPPPAQRYLVIKSWGCGFCSDVTQVLGGLLLAEATGRIPVVHRGRNSLFGDGSAANAFHHYFEPVSNITLDDIARLRDAAFFPPKWSPQNLTAEDVSKWQGIGHGPRRCISWRSRRRSRCSISTPASSTWRHGCRRIIRCMASRWPRSIAI